MRTKDNNQEILDFLTILKIDEPRMLAIKAFIVQQRNEVDKFWRDACAMNEFCYLAALLRKEESPP